MSRVGWLAIVCACGVLAAAWGTFVLGTPYPVEQLAPSRSAPLCVVDRRGEQLWSVAGPHGHPGRADWVTVDQIAPAAVLTLLASEDQNFFEHPGVDGWAVLRAIGLNLRERGLNYGASTLSMQLVRMLHSKDKPRTLKRKFRETLLALRLDRSLTKRAILEQYLNRAYFGHGAYGIQAAARRYFAKPARSLSLGEATFLMVLPRGPSFYDPLKHKPRVLARRDHLLSLLVAQGRLSPSQAGHVRTEPVRVALFREARRAGHFVNWVVSDLPAEVRQRGGVLHTSLDFELQAKLEYRTGEHVRALAGKGVEQAGVVVLDTQRGEVLAMVGSADYWQSQLNITTYRRHPGSALKPFVYAAAIERGASPASIAMDVADVPSSYEVRAPLPIERGPSRYRMALAGSYNLAAVHVLEHVGVPAVMGHLLQAGVGQLPQRAGDYGLRLALGSTRVRLLDLAAGYGFLTRRGRTVEPRGVLRAVEPGGRVWRPAPAREVRVFSSRTAWLVADMLSDSEARRPVFGPDLPVDLPYPVVAKTGTARGFADTVMVISTRELTVAAWTGRFDGGPTKGLSGMRGAGQLARAALLAAANGQAWTLDQKPPGIVERSVCALSGALPGPGCTHLVREHFAVEHPPRTRCPWHRLEDGVVRVRYPGELSGWVRRQRLARGDGASSL